MKGIELWTGLRLISLDDLAKEFEVLGVTRSGIRSLCKLLGVAVVHFDKDPYVEYYRFVLRFSAMLSEGKDVHLPKERVTKKTNVTEMDASDMERILKEMAATRAIALKKSTPQMTEEMKDAARKWADAAARARGTKFAAEPRYQLSMDDPRPD